MAKGINKVILIGNLGSDPEIRYATNGKSIANIRIATNESWKDKQTGETQERTEWHRVVLFAPLSEIAQKYLNKGAKVYIEGSLRTSKWQDANGQDRYSTDIIANTMQMLDGKSSTFNIADPAMQSKSSAPELMSENVMDSEFVDDEVPF